MSIIGYEKYNSKISVFQKAFRQKKKPLRNKQFFPQESSFYFFFGLLLFASFFFFPEKSSKSWKPCMEAVFCIIWIRPVTAPLLIFCLDFRRPDEMVPYPPRSPRGSRHDFARPRLFRRMIPGHLLTILMVVRWNGLSGLSSSCVCILLLYTYFRRTQAQHGRAHGLPLAGREECCPHLPQVLPPNSFVHMCLADHAVRGQDASPVRTAFCGVVGYRTRGGVFEAGRNRSPPWVLPGEHHQRRRMDGVRVVVGG